MVVCSFGIIVAVTFILVAIIAGFMLYLHRGSIATSGDFTLKRLLPWTMGYIATTFVVIDSYRGVSSDWLIYALLFFGLSLLYKAFILFSRAFFIYWNEGLNGNTTISFIPWLKRRRQWKNNYYLIYEKKVFSYDYGITTSYIVSMVVVTIVALFKLM